MLFACDTATAPREYINNVMQPQLQQILIDTKIDPVQKLWAKGLCQLFGLCGCTQDFHQGEQTLDVAGQLGDSYAYFFLAGHYQKIGNQAKSDEFLFLAVDGRFSIDEEEQVSEELVLRMAILGECFLNGVGIQKNLAEALRLLKLAANQGCTEAKYALGCCYERGVGIEKDVPQAISLYLEAAKDCVDAQQTLETNAAKYKEIIDTLKNRSRFCVEILYYGNIISQLDKEYLEPRQISKVSLPRVNPPQQPCPVIPTPNAQSPYTGYFSYWHSPWPPRTAASDVNAHAMSSRTFETRHK